MPVLDAITSVARRVLGTTNESMLRRIWPLVHQVRAKEAELQTLDDKVLRERSAALRERVQKKGESLESVLVEALALAREAADRRIGMWNAIDPSKGFPDEAWGDDLATVNQVRAEIAAIMKEAQEKQGQIDRFPWDIDLPASAYAKIRTLHPLSAPPFRMRAHDVQVLGAIVLHQGRATVPSWLHGSLIRPPVKGRANRPDEMLRHDHGLAETVCAVGFQLQL